MMIACVMFSCGDLMTKFLSTRNDASVIVGLRYGITLVMIMGFFMPRMGTTLFKTERTGLVLLRAGALSFASICNALALRYLQLGEAIAIVFLAPFGVIILARVILGERVNPLGWLFAGLGFTGVLLITGPSSGLDPVGVMFAAGAALGTTIYNFLSRFLASSEQPVVLQSMTAFVGTVVFLPAVVVNWGNFHPEVIDIAALSLLCLLFAVSHYLLTLAFSYATPGALTPVNYMQLVFSGGVSYLVYDHIPAPLALVGMTIVLFAGMASVLVLQRKGG